MLSSKILCVGLAMAALAGRGAENPSEPRTEGGTVVVSHAHILVPEDCRYYPCTC